MAATETKPLKAVIEGDATIVLSDTAKTLIRGEYIRELDTTLREVEEAEHALPELDGPEARYQLEILGDALRRAEKAVDVLWWLTPGDGEASE